MHRMDRQSCGLPEQHHRQCPRRPWGNDQQFHPRFAAGNRYHAEVSGLVARDRGDATQRVEVWYAVQCGPVDTDIDDLAQTLLEGFDQFR